MNVKFLATVLFLVVSGVGSLYLAVEAVLQSFGRSICASEGCRVVAQYSRVGDLVLVLAGLSVMAALFVLAFRDLREERRGRDRLLNAMLIAALAAEGVLVGYQVLWLSVACAFCLSVFGTFLALSVLRIAGGHREVLAGFGSLVLILLLFVILLPGGALRLPMNGTLLLFYSEDCRHCSDIRKEIDASGITVDHVLIKNYAATLKALGIEEVPTLLVNGPYEKVFLTGTRAIRQYLAAQRTSPAGTAAGRSRAPGGRVPVSDASSADPARLFSMPATSGVYFNLPPDDGLCKETQKCD